MYENYMLAMDTFLKVILAIKWCNQKINFLSDLSREKE
jgi:hypothetical protein